MNNNNNDNDIRIIEYLEPKNKLLDALLRSGLLGCGKTFKF